MHAMGKNRIVPHSLALERINRVINIPINQKQSRHFGRGKYTSPKHSIALKRIDKNSNYIIK